MLSARTEVGRALTPTLHVAPGASEAEAHALDASRKSVGFEPTNVTGPTVSVALPLFLTTIVFVALVKPTPIEPKSRLDGVTVAAGPPLPIVLHGAMAATYHGEVVVLGGWAPDQGGATSNQVYELVRYVEQSNPNFVERLLAALSRDGLALTVAGASIAAIAIKRVSECKGMTRTTSASRR